MNNQFPKSPDNTDGTKKGFALVLALSLLSLVFLVVVSLVSLVGTDLSLSEARKQRILSKVHARMGMRIAIGEIQKHLGPDMRISATADILDERINSGKEFVSENYSESTGVQDGIDLNENGVIDSVPFGQRYWTGVWKHRARAIGADDIRPGTKPLPENLETGDSVNTSVMADTSYDPHPAIELAWLVSGNEGHSKNLFLGSSKQMFDEYVEIPDGNIWDTSQLDNGRGIFKGGVYGKTKNAWKDYQEAIISNKMSDYDHPLISLEESEETTWILKAPLLGDTFSYDPANPDSWINNLRGEPIKVRKTELKEIRESSNIELIRKVGFYAYWVGDEGVKTKVNLDFDFLDDLGLSPEGKKLLETDRITVAMKPNLGLSEDSNDAGFDFNLDSLDEDLIHRVTSPLVLSDLLTDAGDALAKDKFSAHYHSLTAESHGVLSDTRTGGLKRDLSSAFAMDSEFTDDLWDLEDDNGNWANDFKGFIFKDRVHCLKSVPMDEDAKENEWYVSADDATIDDKNAILAGPRWTVLGSYHNLYQSNSMSDLLPDDFPRIMGDNMLLFSSADGSMPESPNPFWKNLNELLARYNWFNELRTRPEPKNHPIQPILTEIKYSHTPIWDNTNGIGLAMFPSVAFWNPYNEKIDIEELFMELPLRVSMRIMNPLEYDSYRKWFVYNYENSSNPDPNSNFPPVNIPPGFKNFEDLNGNGRRDPGEPYFFYGGTSPSSQPSDPWRVLRDGFNYNLDHCRVGGISQFYHRNRPDGFQTWGRFHREFLLTSDVLNDFDQLISPRNRHLLLHIQNIELDPGEKAHFVVSGLQSIPYTDPPERGSETEFITVNLSQGSDLNPFVCYASIPISGNSAIYSTDPITVRTDVYGIQGIHPRAMETFNGFSGERRPVSQFVKPKGITLYSSDPDGVPSANREVVFKLNKGFSISVGGQRMDFFQAQDLPKLTELTVNDALVGNGFRIRLKLPGLADCVVKEQYNLRALIHSYQDGYGDNWEQEEFVQTNASNNESTFNYFARYNEDMIDNGYASDTLNFDQDEDDNLVLSPVPYYFDFYQIPQKYDENANFYDFNRTAFSLSSLNPLDDAVCDYDFFVNTAVVPRAQNFSTSIGFFHDFKQEHGDDMEADEEAVLFEIPKNPMLSIFQLRHANLNNYCHGPTYSMGNSYASTQVARYKTWARVRAITFQPKSSLMNIARNIQNARGLAKLGNPNFFNWKNRLVEYGPVRDSIAQNEHQNTTLDHSYYLNRSLVDGYFLTGVANPELSNSQVWNEKDENIFAPGYYYLPYRNPRLLPYYRENEWQQTSYGTLSSTVTSAEDDEFRYQTKAADLLLNGSFNINSTSVDAWFSQLSALRGISVPSGSSSINSNNSTPFPRFTNHPDPKNNSWNKLRTLTDDEVSSLAFAMVEQVKLRGPFLSFSDFTNRRIQGNKANRLLDHFSDWDVPVDKQESRSSVLGLRGAVQAAIAESGLNDGGFTPRSADRRFLVDLPSRRYNSTTWDPNAMETPFRSASTMGYVSSEFGIHALSKYMENDGKSYLHPAFKNHQYYQTDLANEPESIVLEEQKWGRGKYEVSFTNPPAGSGQITTATGDSFVIRYGWDNYEDAFSFGEAPENILAVENVATAANKPGWLMQSDVLSPLAPVTSARSDTFMVRVMGEYSENNQSISSKAWIELTVQRTPDYVKPDLDAPHHRPHEPFEDRNFNGYWDSGSNREHWLDLNQNSRDNNGRHIADSYPDLPGSPIGKDWYADGLQSDLPLEIDPDEESNAPFSRLGINQRFGRKFKIIKFRWLKEQDV